MELGLKGKKAFITGASRGIGRAIAETLAAEGADVAICARKEKPLADAAEKLRGHGTKVVFKALDVKDGDALKAWVKEAAEQLGGLDLLVANPSSGNTGGESGWRSNFEIDLLGAVRSVETALPFLGKSEAPSVLFISSTAAVETFMQPGPYNAIKAALINYASGLAHQHAAKGIRVNTISPGPVYFEGGNWQMVEKMMPDMYKGTLSQCPTGRMGTPEEVARAAAFLLSPAASLISGVNLVADGCFTKRVDY